VFRPIGSPATKTGERDVGDGWPVTVGLAFGDRLLAAGAMRATVRAEAGGRVAALWREEIDGRRTDLLMPMTDAVYDPFVWPKTGSYPLVPWSNLIRDSRFRFDGAEARVVPNPTTAPHALHGFAQMRPWNVTAATDATLDLNFAHVPSEVAPWPWAFESTQHLVLAPDGLSVEIAVKNLSDKPMPAGLGAHPFLMVRHGDRIRFACREQWQTDASGFATGRREAAAPYDAPQDATARTQHYAGWDGRATIERPDGTRIEIAATAPLDQLVFHVPAGGAYACLEPVSHVVDAFNLAPAGVEGTGLRRLAPGERLAAMVKIGLG